MEISNPNYELILELEAFNEKINEFWDFYQFLGTADRVTKRYYYDMTQQFTDGNFLNAKTCINKLIERLDKEKESNLYINLKHYFVSAIKELKHADEICDKFLNSVLNESLDEKTTLKKQIRECNVRLSEIQDNKMPYLNLSVSIMLIIMASIFFFLPDFFYNKVVMYHLCGFLLFWGIFLLNQEIVYRNKKGFIFDSENSTNKRSIVLLIQAFVYMIPLAILSYFFFDSLILRIFLYVQIFFCGVLFLDGSFILISNSFKNKKVEKKSIWGIVLELITIAGFVLQLLQIFKVI